jgi:hypothetical protein
MQEGHTDICFTDCVDQVISIGNFYILYLEGAYFESRPGYKSLLTDFLNVGFEGLTAVVMKSTIFWDITPCSPLKVN